MQTHPALFDSVEISLPACFFSIPSEICPFFYLLIFHEKNTQIHSLSAQAPEGQAALVFGSVFVIVWCGAGVVTLNALLLGGKISFFQSVCVLGYCLFPLTLSAIVCLIYGHIAFRLVVVGVGFFWSTGASVGFMGETVPKSRRLLSVYPVFLFYIAISWMLLLK
eukprot:comp12423_c0_seq1/m.16271 comp12423_c0_seq1/g.16271  ORF comp12423_c0_seq1/g.16271 comp12423_c0_seq1/m.16271 type:complete len:165 (-) comp12423_c0_seq1:56-550(-)